MRGGIHQGSQLAAVIDRRSERQAMASGADIVIVGQVDFLVDEDGNRTRGLDVDVRQPEAAAPGDALQIIADHQADHDHETGGGRASNARFREFRAA